MAVLIARHGLVRRRRPRRGAGARAASRAPFAGALASRGPADPARRGRVHGRLVRRDRDRAWPRRRGARRPRPGGAAAGGVGRGEPGGRARRRAQPRRRPTPTAAWSRCCGGHGRGRRPGRPRARSRDARDRPGRWPGRASPPRSRRSTRWSPTSRARGRSPSPTRGSRRASPRASRWARRWAARVVDAVSTHAAMGGAAGMVVRGDPDHDRPGSARDAPSPREARRARRPRSPGGSPGPCRVARLRPSTDSSSPSSAATAATSAATSSAAPARGLRGAAVELGRVDRAGRVARRSADRARSAPAMASRRPRSFVGAAPARPPCGRRGGRSRRRRRGRPRREAGESVPGGRGAPAEGVAGRVEVLVRGDQPLHQLDDGRRRPGGARPREQRQQADDQGPRETSSRGARGPIGTRAAARGAAPRLTRDPGSSERGHGPVRGVEVVDAVARALGHRLRLEQLHAEARRRRPWPTRARRVARGSPAAPPPSAGAAAPSPRGCAARARGRTAMIPRIHGQDAAATMPGGEARRRASTAKCRRRRARWPPRRRPRASAPAPPTPALVVGAQVARRSRSGCRGPGRTPCGAYEPAARALAPDRR